MDADPQVTPQEHPDRELLTDLVLGGLVPARRAVLEAHLAFCAPCRELITELAKPGGTFLRQTTPDLPRLDLWTRIEKALPEARTPEARTPEARTPEARTPEARTPEARTPEDPFGRLPVPQSARDELALSGPLDWEPIGAGRVARLAADREE